MTERSLVHQPRHPPDVEQALSSMLWTPYERTPNESSTDDEDEFPKLMRRSQSHYEQRQTNVYHQRLNNTLEFFRSDLNTTNYVPFNNLILNTATSNHDMHTQSENSSITTTSAAAVAAAALPYNYRYSNPCYGVLPNFSKKCWPPSTSNAKILPTYESLYAFKSFPKTLNSNVTAGTAVSMAPKNIEHNSDTLRKLNINARDNNCLMSADYKDCAKQHVVATCCNDVRDDIWQEQHDTNIRSQQNVENNNPDIVANEIYARIDRERVNQLAAKTRTVASATCIKQQTTISAATTITSTSEDSGGSLQKYCDKATNASYNEFLSVELSVADELSTTQTISSTSAFEVNGCLLSVPVFNVFQTLALASITSTTTSTSLSSSPPPAYFGSSECLSFAAATPSLTSSTTGDDCSTNTLTPNKCLAELERLYAEFRASESAFEQRLHTDIEQVDQNNKSQYDSDSVNNNCSDNTNNNNINNNNKEQIVRAQSQQTKLNMRLNIPAATATTATVAVASVTATTGTDNSTSSVFLTTTATNNRNSINNNNNDVFHLTAATSATKNAASCQRHPSLTIQVNSNNNHNNNNNSNNNQQHNYTSDNSVNQKSVGNNNHNNINNNNCVSVVNCAYVQGTTFNSNNNNNNINLNDIKNNNINDNNANLIRREYSIVENNSCSRSDNNNVSIVPTSATSVSVTNATSTKLVDNKVALLNTNNNNNNDKQKNVSRRTSDTVNIININETNPNDLLPRTYISTECQTDDVTPIQLIATSQFQREQRRRERRERRQHRQDLVGVMLPTHRRLNERHSMPPAIGLLPSPPVAAASPQMPTSSSATTLHAASPTTTAMTMPHSMSALLRPMLPDILHNHYPPPYSALSLNGNILHNNAPPSSLIGVPSAPPPLSVAPPLPPPPPPTILTPVISTLPIPGATQIVTDGRFSLPLPIIRR